MFHEYGDAIDSGSCRSKALNFTFLSIRYYCSSGSCHEHELDWPTKPGRSRHGVFPGVLSTFIDCKSERDE